MSDEQIEAVAKALYESFGFEYPWESMEEIGRESVRVRARTMIIVANIYDPVRRTAKEVIEHGHKYHQKMDGQYWTDCSPHHHDSLNALKQALED